MTDQQRKNLTENQVKNLMNAMFSESFPPNPIPFAMGLADYVKDNCTDSITSDEAKRILGVLMAQSYGQLSTIDLCEEWDRLERTK